VRRFFAAASIALVAAVGLAGPAGAAPNPPRDQGTKPGVNWNQHDTAVYVVSTLNLLRGKHGHTLVSAVQQRSGVSRFDVLSDNNVSGLYFIQLKTGDGSVYGAFAYAMGWSRPRSLSSVFDRFHLHRAPGTILKAYAGDPRTLIGSFTTTLPSS